MYQFVNRFCLKTILVMFLAIVVVAFGFEQAGAASGSKKILRIAYDAADTKSLDPGFSFGTQDTAQHNMIYNGLLRFKPGDIAVVEPDLAESYEVSKDGMELTFHIRKGVMTHPFKGYPEGYEFTAEDAAWSLKKSANPKTCRYSGPFKNFVPEVIDKYTLKVRLKKRVPNPERMFVYYRGGHMVPKKAYETIGAARFKTQPVGTGPFRVVKYVPGTKVVHVANEKYFRGRPKLDGVEVLMMPDVNSREFALRRGEADVIEGVREQPWIDKMRKVPNCVVDIFGPGEQAFLSFDALKKPFDNPLVRKALCYAINRDELLAFVGRDASERACNLIPDFYPGGLTCDYMAKNKPELLYKFNQDKAKELLAKAGLPKGFSFDETISERASYLRCTENLQAQWKRVGVNMKLNMVDHPTYHTRIRQGVNPYVLYICVRPSPDVWLTYFYHSDSIVVTGKNPVTNFTNSNIVDKEIEAARNETDREKQAEHWRQAQFKLLDSATSYSMYWLKIVFARSPKVKWNYEMKANLNFPEVIEVVDIVK